MPVKQGDIIHLRFPRNYGRAWVELLESGLSEHARMCYVAMTSFGEESFAGKTSIARRMGVKSLSTVKLAQKELIRAGWIQIKVQGGGLKATEWEVFASPFNGQLSCLEPKAPGRNTPRSHSALYRGAQRPLNKNLNKNKRVGPLPRPPRA